MGRIIIEIVEKKFGGSLLRAVRVRQGDKSIQTSFFREGWEVSARRISSLLRDSDPDSLQTHIGFIADYSS